MIKYLLVFILALFQDNYVRVGTIVGALSGFWSTHIFHGNPITNSFIFGFIGWGFGVYLANYFEISGNSSKKKFRFIKGGKN